MREFNKNFPYVSKYLVEFTIKLYELGQMFWLVFPLEAPDNS